jgi:hypothetical protein
MTQNEQILAALKRGPLTQADAVERFQCYRLAARILELRERGYPIAAERVVANGTQFARYRLART